MLTPSRFLVRSPSAPRTRLEEGVKGELFFGSNAAWQWGQTAKAMKLMARALPCAHAQHPRAQVGEFTNARPCHALRGANAYRVQGQQGPARRFDVMGRASSAHSPASPLFIMTAPMSATMAKRARSVAHRALLFPHKPTLWTQLSKDPTAPLPTFHPMRML